MELISTKAAIDAELEAATMELEIQEANYAAILARERSLDVESSAEQSRQQLWGDNNKLDHSRDALLMSMEADKHLETVYEENLAALNHMNPYFDAFNICIGMALFK